jgi:hypothetical protein
LVGKVFMISNVSFALIIKNQNVKLSLHKGEAITVRINNQETTILSKVFFFNKLIRGSSIYNYREYIWQQLPTNHPLFQVELGYIGASKDAAKHSIQVMMLSTKLSDSDAMATILESKFNNPTHMSSWKCGHSCASACQKNYNLYPPKPPLRNFTRRYWYGT